MYICKKKYQQLRILRKYEKGQTYHNRYNRCIHLSSPLSSLTKKFVKFPSQKKEYKFGDLELRRVLQHEYVN